MTPDESEPLDRAADVEMYLVAYSDAIITAASHIYGAVYSRLQDHNPHDDEAALREILAAVTCPRCGPP